MDGLNLTPAELKWLEKENVIPVNELKVENWLGNISEPIVIKSPKKTEIPRKKVKLENLLIGEIGCTAMALSRGKDIVNVEDAIVLVRSKHSLSTPKKSFWEKSNHKESIVRLKNKRTGSEFGKLTLDNSVFISTLMDLEMCEFDAQIIYCPPVLKMADEILVNLRVYLRQSAFSQKIGSDLEPNNQVLYRKKALVNLFQRTGLLNQEEIKESKLAVSDPDSISATDLSRIYSKANLIDKNLTKSEPAKGMVLELRDYQKIALSFMLTKENHLLDTKGMSPLWKKMKSVDGTFFYYNPYSGELSKEYPVEHHCKGGILADEMGLGKTIEVLSLVHTNRLIKPKHKLEKHATLIVCPLNLASQWIEEAKRCFEPEMKTFMYYGDNRKLDWKHMNPDIVVTTYGTMTSEFVNPQTSALYSVHWHRIVLDEAHLIKDRSTKTAKAAYGLNATNRWAVTGTPIINKLEYFELISDLFSLVHFLRVEPWCQFSFWNSFVTTPFSKRDPKALEVVQTILEPLIIRRTKDQKDSDGNPIVSLPSKTITIQRLTFSEEEQQLYDSMSNFSRKKLDYLKLIGKADYLHIFSLILRLRQLCDHKYLITASEKNESLFSKDLEELLKDHEGDQQFKDQVTTELQAKESKECPICFEDCYCGVLFPCLHSLCKSCLDDIMERTVDELECPICRKPCKETEIMQIVEPQTNTGKITLTSLDFKMSTKLHALVKEILRINCESPKEKMIVFSQWTSMLDICQVAFKENKISFVRLDGSLSQKDRDKVLSDFNHNNDTLVLLASLRSSGVGLNLTVASRVFLMEPWWNESVENQAIDRVHRLGQTRPVFVTRYVIENSVEEKMLKIQEKKSRIVGALTGNQGTANLEELLTLFW